MAIVGSKAIRYFDTQSPENSRKFTKISTQIYKSITNLEKDLQRNPYITVSYSLLFNSEYDPKRISKLAAWE